ncbi:hypothetical protein MAR_021868 [Mya arenaria]|uniref:Uncharacterized protein n=1 Tax=Mya arenaria TaxID=6604 RepID=A0ABY7EDM8_MYAAR|nr:hypothetical protein MAR_021868 [Mya arenaria]
MDVKHLRHKRLDAWANRLNEHERARLEDDEWFTPVLIGCGAILLLITIIFLLRLVWKKCRKESSQPSVPFKPLKSVEEPGLRVVYVEKV